MQIFKQTVLDVVDQMKILGVSDASEEVALLFLWRQYQAGKYNTFPSLESVSKGQDLATIYKEISGGLGLFGYAFEKSKLPDVIATSSLRGILKRVIQARKVNNSDLFDVLSSLSLNTSKHDIVSLLPAELVDLMTSVTTSELSDIYVPFSCSVQLAVRSVLSRKSVFFEPSSFNLPLMSALPLFDGVVVQQGDPIRNPSFLVQDILREFSCVLMAPPLGLRYKEDVPDPYHRFPKKTINGDVLAIEHALAQCSGRLVTVGPTGILFRGASDYDLRTKLVDLGWLEAVIKLPSGLLPSTSIPLVVLIIDKQRDINEPVLFCDADQPDWVLQGGRGKSNNLIGWKKISSIVKGRLDSMATTLVGIDKIRENKYDLTVSRYVLGSASQSMMMLKINEKVICLEHIADLIRAQALKEEKNPQGDEYLEVCAKDIGSNGYVIEPTKCLRLSGRMRVRAELQKLRPGDLLFTSRGNVGRVALVGDNCGDNWVANQSDYVIRLRDNSDINSPEYLFQYLTSPLVKGYIDEQITGTTIPMLSTKEIKDFPIVVSSDKKQKQVVQTHKKILVEYSRIELIRNNIGGLRQEYWPFIDGDFRNQ